MNQKTIGYRPEASLLTRALTKTRARGRRCEIRIVSKHDAGAAFAASSDITSGVTQEIAANITFLKAVLTSFNHEERANER